MENKRKNIYITIFVITTIIASCLAVYFAITKNNETEKLQAKVDELTSQNNELNENSQVVENNVTTQEKVVEKVVEKYGRFNVNASNCLNNTNGHVYSDRIGFDRTVYGLNCNYTNDKEVTISLDMKDFNMYFPNISSETGTKEWKVNFSKKVVDIVAGGFGQAAGNETIFFIMEDGTVEYMPLATAVKNNSIKSYGKLEGVNDIISIKTVSAGAPNGGGWVTTIAFNKDGKFYDLDYVLRKMNVLQ